MSKRIFVKIANMLAEEMKASGLVARETVSMIGTELADILEAEFPRFDREKFLEASGIK